MHICPRCGIETEGSWSEGGLKWAICERCMNTERELSADEFYDFHLMKHEEEQEAP